MPGQDVMLGVFTPCYIMPGLAFMLGSYGMGIKLGCYTPPRWCRGGLAPMGTSFRDCKYCLIALNLWQQMQFFMAETYKLTLLYRIASTWEYRFSMQLETSIQHF
jgi:hypothetical protein